MLAALLLVASACATSGGAQDGRVEELAGCYQFRWTAAAKELGLPWGFELLPDSLEGWPNVPDARVARTRVTEGMTRDHPFAFWRSLEGDSIRVAHPGGGGFSLTLAPEGPDLVGTARPVGDVLLPGERPGPRPARPVTALRVLCPPAAPGSGSG